MAVARRAPPVGPLARIAGFIAHLRRNGFVLGPAETAAAARFLGSAEAMDPRVARLGLKAMLTGDRHHWERFDGLFDAYWFGRGARTVTPAAGPGGARGDHRPALWDRALGTPPGTAGSRIGDGDDVVDGGAAAATRLAASRREALAVTDLRRLISPEEMAAAERVAERFARAIRYRLSRRRAPDPRGAALDLRRTIRRNLPHGGEPLELLRKRRPERPVNLVLMLDVSGSMQLYGRYLLAFVRGLVGQSVKADAFVFHTRLVHVAGALRDPDRGRAMDRLSLLVEGFGGGTRIASALKAFNDRYARATLHSRSVVVVLSDGYDSDAPEALAAELKRLKRRARRLVWLNPLIGWRDYAPVARGMAAALPFIDCFAPAHSLASLAALEGELARL